MSLKRALAEEAELEKQLLAVVADPDSSTSTPVPNVDTFNLDEDDGDPTDSQVDPQVSTESEADKKIRQSWKQRFANYKGSTDKTISNLRKDNLVLIGQISDARKEIDRLAARIADMQNSGKDLFGDSITPEDVETIGVEAVDIVKKATKRATEAAVNPPKEEINKLKAKELEMIKKNAEERRAAEYKLFTADLGRLVPDYQAINLDPGFEVFMMATDPVTGERRLDSFRRAEDYLDADRVADFFLDYKASIPKSKKEMLEDKITPSGAASSSAPSVKKVETFSIREVNKFFDDVSKGAYRNRKKEADELEARITKAYVEGRITD